ncbi:MAG TPA: winged helix-turn-helix domain-containing protein [Longimicrobiaceae bacterium]
MAQLANDPAGGAGRTPTVGSLWSVPLRLAAPARRDGPVARAGVARAMPEPPEAPGDPRAGASVTLVETIRQGIVGALHMGALHAGDRLPSIRQTARAFSVTPYMVLQSYAELEVEGLVERRERSGVFVAGFEVASPAGLSETGAWLTEVLTQACQHQVKIPHLPDLIRRWTTAVRVRCACVESCVDSRVTLALELSQQFGIEATPVPVLGCAPRLADVDLVITTAYHAAEVSPIAEAIGKPVLIATLSPLILSAALNHLRERDLTVICVDRAYGERLRALHGGAYRDRLQVITVDDADGLAEYDRSQPVLLTGAARQRLEQPDFRLVAPTFPSYSIEFARKVAEALVRINLRGARA